MIQRPDLARRSRARPVALRAQAAHRLAWIAPVALACAALLAATIARSAGLEAAAGPSSAVNAPAANPRVLARIQGNASPPAAAAPSTSTSPAQQPTAPVATDGASALRPFKASFVLEWKGMNAASASLEFARQGDGSWSYVSRNNARGVFRAVFPGELTQVSRLQLEGGQVRPLSYRGDDGSADQSRDVALDFDWNRRRVTGTAEKKPVDLELQPGLQDVMSVQIALIVDLLAGRKPAGYTLVDKDRIKDYVYTDEGKARVATVLGTLDTVVWSSHRPNSDRVTRVWYAPSLGHAPVKAERRRGDRLEWSMRLATLQR